MVRIPEQTIEEIKRQSNIVDTVSQYVQLRKSGKNHFAHCPFHEDRTPSFSVSEDKQIFHCFSCGRGGDIFGFLREMEGFSFVEAVIFQAESIGYPLSDELKNQVNSRSATQDDSDYSLLLRMHEKAAEFYHHVLLNTRAGEQALAYLKERGLDEEIIKEFQIGFSPFRQREALVAYLKGQMKEIQNKEYLLKQSGLFSDYQMEEQDKYFDRFSGRIIFPLTNVRGAIVAFSGRIFAEEASDQSFQTAKYLNSPETIIFNKRKMLYHMDKSKAIARRENEIILFEGYMDVIAAYQAGVQHGIASMGTSLTEEQLELIDRYTQKVVIAYDGDDAGLEATKRAIDLIHSHTPFDIEIVLFPQGEDPDNYVRNYGVDRFKDLMSHGRETVMTFFMQYYRRHANLDNERELLTYIHQVLTELAKVDSPVERELYLKQLSESFNLSLESLTKEFREIEVEVNKERLSQIKDQKHQIEQKMAERALAPTQREISRSEKAEQMLLHRLLYSDDAWEYVKIHYPNLQFIHSVYQLIYILYEDFRKKGHTSPDLFINDLDTETAGVLSEIMMIDLGDQLTDQEIIDYVTVISEKHPLEQKLADRRLELEEAKRVGDHTKELELTISITNILKQMKNNQ